MLYSISHDIGIGLLYHMIGLLEIYCLYNGREEKGICDDYRWINLLEEVGKVLAESIAYFVLFCFRFIAYVVYLGCILMMISIVIIIIKADSVISDTNGFIFFCLQPLGDTRSETQFIKAYTNHTILTPPSSTAHLVVSKISTHLFWLRPI